MQTKNKKQFGVWMDSRNAVVVGKEPTGTGEFKVIGRAINEGADKNSNENTMNNQARTLQQRFFRQIAAHMQNVDELHVTGTGTEQEQFIHYMADTAQYKDMVSDESTSNRMTDEKLVQFITAKFA
jgi:stalled ribosome rescue protein Dom34